MDELLIANKLPKLTPFEGTWGPEVAGDLEAGWRARISPFEMPSAPRTRHAVSGTHRARDLVDERRKAANVLARRISEIGDDAGGSGGGGAVNSEGGIAEAQKARRNQRAGFTLLELLIATLLLSLLSVGIVMSLRVGLSAMNKVDTG